MSHPVDEEIMVMVKNDNVEMLAVLFERHHVKLYNYLYRLTRDAQTSEDLVQDIFTRIIKYRNTYRGDSKFLVWLYQIARNVHIDYLRKHKNEFPYHERWEQEIAPGGGPDLHSEHREDISLLHQALDKLPVKKREILILSRFQNLKYREIAELLECSIESIKVNVHRAIKELRKNYMSLRGGTL